MGGMAELELGRLMVHPWTCGGHKRLFFLLVLLGDLIRASQRTVCCARLNADPAGLSKSPHRHVILVSVGPFLLP
jgi:hypothetical protein